VLIRELEVDPVGILDSVLLMNKFVKQASVADFMSALFFLSEIYVICGYMQSIDPVASGTLSGE
jgi:hypothetical protein